MDGFHACRLYIDAVHPAERATVIIDNNDLSNPGLFVDAGR
jgi:hypothetical protein